MYGFKYGFGLAGIGMLLGFLIFYAGRNNYAAADGLEITEAGKKESDRTDQCGHGHHSGLIVRSSRFVISITQNSWLDYILLGLFIYIGVSMVQAGAKADRENQVKIWKDRMIALIIFMVINITFWACFEQAGNFPDPLYAAQMRQPRDPGMDHAGLHDAVLQSILHHRLWKHLLSDVGEAL